MPTVADNPVSPKLSYVAKSKLALPDLVITTVEPLFVAVIPETPLIAVASLLQYHPFLFELGQLQKW